jgi:hypothetical protein
MDRARRVVMVIPRYHALSAYVALISKERVQCNETAFHSFVLGPRHSRLKNVRLDQER